MNCACKCWPPEKTPELPLNSGKLRVRRVPFAVSRGTLRFATANFATRPTKRLIEEFVEKAGWALASLEVFCPVQIIIGNLKRSRLGDRY